MQWVYRAGGVSQSVFKGLFWAFEFKIPKINNNKLLFSNYFR
jgi:hypothetical protein